MCVNAHDPTPSATRMPPPQSHEKWVILHVRTTAAPILSESSRFCLNTRSSIHRLLSAKMLEVGHGKGPKDPNDGPQPQKAHRARKRSTDEGGGAGGNEAGRVGFVQTGRGQDGEDKASADEV